MSSKIDTAKKKELLSKALDALYGLEDLTGYGNKNVGTAINLLQKEVPKT